MGIKSIGFLCKKVVEFFFWNESVLVEVGSFDHFLEGVVVSEFSQIFGNSSQVLQGDKT